jgi:hypothetical protein
MNRLVENNIDFFDSVSLFSDFWSKNSDLSIKFVLSSVPNQTKAVLTFHTDNEEQLKLFKRHVLEHFQSHRLVNQITITSDSIELLMVEQQ